MQFSANTIASNFKELAGGDYQTALLYAAISGAVISDVLPTPATAWAYFRMKKLQKQKADGLITQKELEEGIAKGYAVALPAWWILVFAAVHFKKGSFEDRGKLAIMLVGSGAIFGALFKQYIKNLPKYETT
jgi:hypothetical protein